MSTNHSQPEALKQNLIWSSWAQCNKTSTTMADQVLLKANKNCEFRLHSTQTNILEEHNNAIITFHVSRVKPWPRCCCICEGKIHRVTPSPTHS